MIRNLTLAASLLLSTIQFCFAAEEVEPKVKYLMCAVANVILSSQMGKGFLTDFIESEARRHIDLAKKAGATESDFAQAREGMVAAYNQGKMSWDEIGDLGESCTSIQ